MKNLLSYMKKPFGGFMVFMAAMASLMFSNAAMAEGDNLGGLVTGVTAKLGEVPSGLMDIGIVVIGILALIFGYKLIKSMVR